ncbi:MAG: DUF4185 domain-containing protein [Chitinispirillia bacterium]|jgi:hypothetical protein
MNKLFTAIIFCFLLMLVLYKITFKQGDDLQNFTRKVPYKRSESIKDIKLDWSSHKRLAIGSDNWPVTWAADNSQYTAFGDGGGFNGTNKKGRVSLGVSRIVGPVNKFKGHNIWGGYRSKTKSNVDGKSYGILAIDDVMYMWVSPGSDARGYQEARLYFSKDNGYEWNLCGWSFKQNDGIIYPTFLQYGKNYQFNKDDFVYIYAANLKSRDKLMVQKPGEIVMLRVPKNNILNREKYVFFSGFDDDKNPKWTNNINERFPVFKDQNGVGWTCSASYVKKFDRYFLTTEHSESFKGNFGIFEAVKPWGPWTTIYYVEGFGSNKIEKSCFFLNFSNKFTYENKDNKVFLIFTGVGKNDSFNFIEASFEITK